ncbi:MAG: formyltransferase family protein [candidate division Zixibacteria bacterium]|nr:formyltransferase family protein [candidate division Zixibacteria bacterium]MDD5425688.1 formyltransferase family protein [candidate division Zixibacteria bacterium]
MSREPDVYVLSYDYPHRKTQDLLYRLKLAGFNVGVLALEWQKRQNHQPLFGLCLPNALDYKPQKICEILGFKYRWVGVIDEHFHWTTDKPILVGGAPILNGNFVSNNRIFNVHPGWLPKVRGLDSLKWAIYYSYPIGVTVHRINREIDFGKLVLREEIPLFPTDCLQTIAIRQYERGLDLLVQALVTGKIYQTEEYTEPAGIPTRRMKHADELIMKERLNRRLMDLQMLSSSTYTDCPLPAV